MNESVEKVAPSLFTEARRCLDASNLEEKASLTQQLAAAWRSGELSLREEQPPQIAVTAGHPQNPQLVAPRDLPKRSFYTPVGRAALFHSIAHIEFNAINLALDAVYRFRGMPEAFYGDWLKVAEEEAYHFGLIRAHLQQLGYEYGDFAAHNGLWESAQQTAYDVMVRMALVPRVLEARGLDVAPAIMERLARTGDDEAVDILKIIQRDEIGHVEIGSHWFHYCCSERGLDSEATFFDLINQYMKGVLKGPFNIEARIKAGFSASELNKLQGV
ncbi:MAG: ferritin-like domain-containing protein [Gammaproteobacteria bacterium]|nr:ferritin-like domain-containing protein [Gammaproteobacteria bacterium]MCF6230445.1 ferritin-like domain-containing protein [Gammaproteobacteria bacterium]